MQDRGWGGFLIIYLLMPHCYGAFTIVVLLRKITQSFVYHRGRLLYLQVE
jgi:hypothetical protein